MTDWQDAAACLGCDPEVFFPPPKVNAVEAKTICAGCDVRLECLDYAIETSQRHGVWGGMTPRERRVEARRRMRLGA